MARTPKDLTEAGFEEYIEEQLLNRGYLKGSQADYNKDHAMDTKMLFDFLEDSQPQAMERLKAIYKDQYKFKIMSRLDHELRSRNIIDVLRHGIKDYGVKLDLAYFKPATSMNKEMVENYNKNRISVTRQLRYSNKNENSVDMVIFVNGLPVVVMELKNPFTGQNYTHAIHQFKYSRHPNEPLFRFKRRTLVCFAVDTDEVHMTTRLSGASTVFLPFNKGNDGGKGNPPAEDGFRTAYLWQEVLTRDSLLDIIKRFVFLEEAEGEDGKKKETMIFPRYHQLDCVRKLEAAAKADGAGKNYLIQHSAGSGKTKSISWLAHRLANLHDDEDNPVFNSVIVVTDRRALDRQLQDSIYQLEHKYGVVKKVDRDSAQLADALKSGTKIIISTLQKFPFIIEKVGELGDRKYAVIIDEAHSSTSGEIFGSLREVLHASSLEEAEQIDSAAEAGAYDPEDAILEEIRKRGIQPNISFFAFTATPKARTLETFGTPGEDGLPRPFHVYSMRQAIEEGFIMDVLENYVTYETYFRLSKKIEEDPAFERAKATKAITRFVSLHPHNIAQKTEIMIEYFRKVTRHKIGGRAKAMVVTRSRLHAVRYKQAFDEYIKKMGYKDLKTLVAFSGTVNDAGISYTEAGMNKFGEAQTPVRFRTDEYQVLIVAEKYQTGYDEPLLHTMFVDKPLAGLKAVQTLSRLNRTHKDKKDTFILDFVNKAEDIQAAFKPYYETAFIEEVTDPNSLYDLEARLDAAGVYYREEVDQFARVYYGEKTSDYNARINKLVDKAVERYRSVAEDVQEEFAGGAKKFTRLYSFITQITPFEDADLHKLYTYLSFLIKKLPRGLAGTIDLSDEISLDYYANKKIFEGSLSLAGRVRDPLPSGPGGGYGAREDEVEELSLIIERLNQRFGTDFDESHRLFLQQLEEDFVKDEMMKTSARANPVEDFQYPFKKAFVAKVAERMAENERFAARIIDDEEFRNAVMELMLQKVYKALQGA